MDLRNLPDHLSPANRCEERRKLIEREFGIDLSSLSIDPTKLGHAEEKNCEQMFGHVPIPVGYAGPLLATFSSGETMELHLPLATTEGALVASVNRGCKALTMSGGAKTESKYHGVSRSIALKLKGTSRVTPSVVEGRHLRHGSSTLTMTQSEIQKREEEWKSIGQSTSSHLKILRYEIDIEEPYLFLTIYADTDEAMGMNMVTIAADAIGKWLAEKLELPAGRSPRGEGWEFVTVAANVDSDKKPSKRTHDRGRGYEVHAAATIPSEVISTVLKTTPEAMLEVAHAKLNVGSNIAGALGSNLHAANVIAALYLATGQDPAHVVEGSLADTRIQMTNDQFPMSNEFPNSNLQTAANPLSRRERVRERGSADSITISTRLPALLVGVRGGGTTLPAQSQCLNLLLKSKVSGLKSPQQLAESIGAAVLAGELSLLAAQSTHQLARSHKNIARKNTSIPSS